MAVGTSAQVSQQAAKERSAWQSMEPSVAWIQRDGQSVGSAALVDRKGLFLTHVGAVQGHQVKAKLSDGRTVEMTLKASDEPTQLAVLQASDWIKSAKPIVPVEGELKAGDRLLAIVPGGMIRAQYISGSRFGVVSPSQRLMPLSEISFEAAAERISGALVLTPEGKIVGFLNATLRAEPTQQAMRTQANDLTATGEAMRAPMPLFATKRQFGPADMTVAYTTAPSALDRALDSLVRGKSVARPSIGVDVKNAPGGGAQIDAIHPGSGAEEAGLKKGDVVTEINDRPIRDQVDLAKAVMEQQPGASLKIKVKRGRLTVIVPVRVGSKTSKVPVRPESST